MNPKDTTSTGSTAPAPDHQLQALAVQLQGVAGHPLAPAPLRAALPLLLGVLQQQAAVIASFQAHEAAAAERRAQVARKISPHLEALKASGGEFSADHAGNLLVDLLPMLSDEVAAALAPGVAGCAG